MRIFGFAGTYRWRKMTRNFDLSPLMRQWIGFDKLANALQNAG